MYLRLVVLLLIATCPGWASEPAPTKDPDMSMYDPHDIRATRENPVTTGNIPQDAALAEIRQLTREFLDPENAPGPDDPLFFLARPGSGFLVVTHGEDAWLPCFSTAGRLQHYVEATGAADRFETVPASAKTLENLAKDDFGKRTRGIVIDLCPHCGVGLSIGWSSVTKDRGPQVVWANNLATSLVTYRFRIAEVITAYEEGDLETAQALARNVVTHEDAERPEAHFVIGLCAAERGDEETVKRKRGILAGFGDEWVEALDARKPPWKSP